MSAAAALPPGGTKYAAAGAPPKVAPAPKKARFMSCFYVTKHSWKGKYKRILAVTPESIITLNPQTFEETNAWPYDTEFVGIAPSMKSEMEFIITTKKPDSKKTTA